MNKIQVQNKQVFLLQLTEEEMEIKDPVELVVRMCKKSDYEEEYDPLWLKRPFAFSRKNLKGEEIYRRVLKYLYNHAYDGD